MPSQLLSLSSQSPGIKLEASIFSRYFHFIRFHSLEKVNPLPGYFTRLEKPIPALIFRPVPVLSLWFPKSCTEARNRKIIKFVKKGLLRFAPTTRGNHIFTWILAKSTIENFSPTHLQPSFPLIVSSNRSTLR